MPALGIFRMIKDVTMREHPVWRGGVRPTKPSLYPARGSASQEAPECYAAAVPSPALAAASTRSIATAASQKKAATFREDRIVRGPVAPVKRMAPEAFRPRGPVSGAGGSSTFSGKRSCCRCHNRISDFAVRQRAAGRSGDNGRTGRRIVVIVPGPAPQGDLWPRNGTPALTPS